MFLLHTWLLNLHATYLRTTGPKRKQTGSGGLMLLMITACSRQITKGLARRLVPR
jgi:hypothetical protein